MSYLHVAIRFFVLACCLLACSPSVAQSPEDQSSEGQRVFMIGNSLTWDTRPSLLGEGVQWHVDCGKNLKYIFEHPEAPCVKSSVLWPKALKSSQFDVLCVQPHFGTVLDEDVEVISSWLEMQPQADLVIHTGWNRSKDFAAAYHAQVDHDRMVHNPVYFESLISRLKEKFPDRNIRSTAAIDVLNVVMEDTHSGRAPFAKFEEIYRDAIHLQNSSGRYLMHNIMRQTLGRPVSDQGFELDPEVKEYLDQKLSEFAPADADSSIVPK